MINPPTQKYIERLMHGDDVRKSELTAPKINVDHVSSSVASLYEKLRQVIDFQEEHLLRRNAVLRSLKRRLMLNTNPREIAHPLVKELIRGGYFPNGKIPEVRVDIVETTIKNTLIILNNLSDSLAGNERNELSEWMKELASCELEERLAPPLKERALLSYMVETLAPMIHITENISEEDKYLQIYIACQKALLKSDYTLISYRLFRYYYPDWLKISEDEVIGIGKNLHLTKTRIDQEINNPVGKRIYKIISRHIAPFLIIGDIVGDNPFSGEHILEEKEELEIKLLSAYRLRHDTVKAKVRRSGIRSVISILLSKMFITFLAEIPIDKYITHSFSWPVLAINLLIPPSLMLIIASSIKPPKIEIAPRVAMEAIRYIKSAKQVETYEIRPQKQRGLALNAFLALIFLAISSGVFLGVIYILNKIHFSFLSIVIFFVFFCLIAFSGIKTQQWTRELSIEEDKESFFKFIGDLFFLPFVRVGKWLSGKFKRYNILILLLNLFFEAPLQTVFQFIDSWHGYLKEKKEEME
ncbi:MAG: hypothetical protein V1905_01670 [bacterium]